MSSEIPEDLRRFIVTSVPSVPFVEAMLLFRVAGDVPLEIELIARQLYISEAAAREIVAQLQNARIVKPGEIRPGTFHYSPENRDLDGLLDMLAAFYRTHLVEVTDIVHSKGARQARQFAEAFKLKNER